MYESLKRSYVFRFSLVTVNEGDSQEKHIPFVFPLLLPLAVSVHRAQCRLSHSQITETLLLLMDLL